MSVLAVRLVHLFVALLAVANVGCASAPAVAPMPVTEYRPGPGAAQTLVVLLPGRGDEGADYERHGFVQRLQESDDVDVVAADAHFGYYKSRTLIDRLSADILVPARASGYDNIWMVGISMGGLGAVLTAKERPELVDGIVLIAPYLGRPSTLRKVAEAGGIEAWTPPHGRSSWSDDVWAWLKGYGDAAGDRPPLYLAYGEEDFGARAHQLLEPVVPPGRVFKTPGTHTWSTWSVLWEDLLDERPFSTPLRAMAAR